MYLDQKHGVKISKALVNLLINFILFTKKKYAYILICYVNSNQSRIKMKFLHGKYFQ